MYGAGRYSYTDRATHMAQNSNTAHADAVSRAMTPRTVRHLPARWTMLEAISTERGHEDLSETVRCAIDDYIAMYLKERT